MSFYYPLGLLALLGIPVLILIYIIKSKYTEQTIASTYLWRLSEKFLRRRKPISKLTGILTLILQILAVILAALLIAQPVFTIPNSANDLYFILDGSASMNMQREGEKQTRFDKAKAEIISIIDKSRSGSTYSLVYAGDTTNIMFEGVKDKTQAKANIEELTAGWNAADCSSAMSFAQEYFDNNRSALMYLVTDKQYETENITLIDVSHGENNVAFLEYDRTYEIVDGQSVVCGTGKVISYSADTTLTVTMTLEDWTDDTKKEFTTKFDVKAGEAKEFTVKADTSSYTSLTLSISDGDALKEDNVVILYDKTKSQSRNVLIVSEAQDTMYLRYAIAEAGGANVTVLTPKEYLEKQPAGYGMYVFNGYTPKTLPTNAAIWLVNAIDGSGEGSGISYRDVQVPRDETGPNSYYVPAYTSGTSAQEQLFTKDLVKRDLAIRKYARYGVPRSFTSILKVSGDTVIAAGLNENNDRQVVFAFGVGDSNFGMLDDFLILVRNLMNYSFPSVIDNTAYACGEMMTVNVVPGCESIVLTSPSGKSSTLDTVGKDFCEVQLSETGTYKLTVKTTGNADSTVYAYASVPEKESAPATGGFLMLTGEKENNFSDGFYDKLLAYFIIIAAVLLADWGIYCYEQYQLR